jgi:glycosyltransferase involved in cell wall biosynthesis
MQPLVSVIIPTYNRADLTCRTIDNVFQQTYRNFEIIVVDDGSTDDTLFQLTRYQDRIRIITQKNTGPAIARNHGARVARGEIIAFQDSDDLWRNNKLERQVALLETDTSIPCCLCPVVMRHLNGKPFTSFDHSLVRLRHEQGIWLNVFEVLTTRFVLFNQAAAIRHQAFDKVGGFAEDLRYLEDYDLPLRLSLEGPWAFVREPLVMYGEASPLSFSEEAKKNVDVLKRCELKIYERILALTDAVPAYAHARKNLTRRASIVRCQIAATNPEIAERPIARSFRKLLFHFELYRFAAFRNSPWFPQPRTIPLDPCAARN